MRKENSGNGNHKPDLRQSEKEVNNSEVVSYSPASLSNGVSSPNFSGKSLIKDPDTGFLVPGGNYTIRGFNPERKKSFIKALQELGTLAGAQRVIGISHTTFQNHYHKDPEFKKQADYALNEGKMKQRGEFEIAMLEHGKKKSGFLWAMAWLRHAFPGEFNERKVVEHGIRPESLSVLKDKAEADQKRVSNDM